MVQLMTTMTTMKKKRKFKLTRNHQKVRAKVVALQMNLTILRVLIMSVSEKLSS